MRKFTMLSAALCFLGAVSFTAWAQCSGGCCRATCGNCGAGAVTACAVCPPENEELVAQEALPAVILPEYSLYYGGLSVWDVIPPVGRVTVRDWDDAQGVCSLSSTGSGIGVPRDVLRSTAHSCALYAPGRSLLTPEPQEKVPAAYIEHAREPGINMAPASWASRPSDAGGPAYERLANEGGIGIPAGPSYGQYSGVAEHELIQTGPPPPPVPAAPLYTASPYGNPVITTEYGAEGMGAIPSGGFETFGSEVRH